MKKILMTLISLFMAFAIVGCGGKKDSSSASSQANTKKQTTDEYVFTYNDVTIAMNQDTSEFLDKIGKEQDYFEAKSCAFEGKDKTYVYSSFQLKTYPTGDKDYVNSIVLNDDTVSTTEGVSIGEDRQKIEEVYGKDYSEEGAGIVYSKGKSKLQFILEGDTITAISYVAVTPAD